MANETSGEESGPVRVLARRELVVAADYGQIYIFGVGVFDEFDDSECVDFSDSPELWALSDATDSGRFAGSAGRGFIDLLTPGQYNFETPMAGGVERRAA